MPGLAPVAAQGIDRGRRMRMIATGLLLAMAASFVLLHLLAGTHPAWGYALAFTEAAMVGGLADWFAVTALFRHPLGLPIPHTAIIPENKDRIASTMAAFIRDNFLTPNVISRRMRGYNIAATTGGYLVDPGQGGQSRLRAGAANLFGDILESLDPVQLGGLVKAGLRHQLDRLDIAPLLGQLLTAAIADRRHLPVLEGFIRRAGMVIEDNEELIRSIIHERANTLLRWTGLDEKVANAVLDGLYKLLAETIVDPDQMLVAARDPGRALSGQLGASIGEFGAALQSDTHLQLLVNRFARRTIVGVATRYGDEIVRLVSETVRRWDARTATDRIEAAVGRDLQFIRINGTLVGGLVGVALHAVTGLL